MSAGAKTRLAIQVVLYNSLSKLPKLLAGIDMLQTENMEVVVRFFDNAPGSGDREFIRSQSLPFPVEFIQSSQGNLGFGRAHNILAAEHGYDSDFLLLLNPDTLPFDDVLVRLMDVAQASPRAALIEAAQFPVEHHKAFDFRTGHTNWCCATCLLVRTRAFQKLGGFDERLFLYCEDVDLSWRAWLTGYECLYAPHAKCVHVSQEDDVGKDRSAEIHHMELGNLYLRSKYFGLEAVNEHFKYLSETAPDLVYGLANDLNAIAYRRPVLRRDPRIELAPDHKNFGPIRWQS